ncbi:MAG: hypothetical protein EZS28_048313, partial [Streblomastix strix]
MKMCVKMTYLAAVGIRALKKFQKYLHHKLHLHMPCQLASRDLKIKFKINPSAFVFRQVDPVLSMAKYCTINKDELLSSGQDRLKDIDLFFRNWSLTFQYTNMYTQVGCNADLVTGICAEELTSSGLKNLVCDIKPVTVSVRNQIIEAVTAN